MLWVFTAVARQAMGFGYAGCGVIREPCGAAKERTISGQYSDELHLIPWR